MPKVSVIIPVYNTERYLRQCLDSVVNQTLKDIEILCVDDGSTDSSLQILREYEKNDNRIHVFTQKNINAGAARNNGLSHATGKYLSFLDADDFFEADMLEKAYDYAEKNQAQITVFGSDHYFQATGKYKVIEWSIRKELLPRKQVFSGKDIPKDRLKAFVGWAWDKLFLREFIVEQQLKFQEQRTTNDMFFVFAAIIRAERICVRKEILAHQRKQEEGTLSVTREKSWYCFYDALQKLRDQFKSWGYWDWMEQDFINYAVHAALWNLSTLKEPTQELLYQKLKNEWVFELEIINKPESFFYNQHEFQQIMRVSALTYDQFYGREVAKVQRVKAIASEHPKVSVIMPSLNVKPFIRECIESVINQTLEDIEIICVDAGSTDGTLEILQEYAALDHRIKLINSDRKSYGYQMNLGLDAARGEFIGIVETDDYVKLDMYEQLYKIAVENQVDFVKADFYRFVKGENGDSLKLTYNQLSQDKSVYGKVQNPQENLELFKLIMNTWSGIYNRDFLNRNHIRHNETPGASYQDNGFWFMTFALAQRAYFVNKPYYMNRRDNPNSSVHSKSKVYCMNEEYAYILEFLNRNPDLKDRLMPMYCFKKYHNYMFTYNRIGQEFKLGYIVRFSEEFAEDYAAGYLKEKIFGKRTWNTLMNIIQDPLPFYLSTSGYVLKDSGPQNQLANSAKGRPFAGEFDSTSYKIGRFITFLPRKIRGGILCYQEHGMAYTLRRVKEKFQALIGR